MRLVICPRIYDTYESVKTLYEYGTWCITPRECCGCGGAVALLRRRVEGDAIRGVRQDVRKIRQSNLGLDDLGYRLDGAGVGERRKQIQV